MDQSVMGSVFWTSCWVVVTLNMALTFTNKSLPNTMSQLDTYS